MADVLRFTLRDERPHRCALMVCQDCGLRAVHVWRTDTPQRTLVCGRCDHVGTLVIERDLPPAQIPGQPVERR